MQLSAQVIRIRLTLMLIRSKVRFLSVPFIEFINHFYLFFLPVEHISLEEISSDSNDELSKPKKKKKKDRDANSKKGK